ncbi:hypothetical protein EPO14_00240 [Patescibacteria group bacterium]|nr:MAG: hypothetical protein EPO14_00240 [Patescibacteria group bacterium]
MRNIMQWQQALKTAAEQKFPNSGWSHTDRLASVRRQLEDVEASLKVESGELQSDDHAHQDPNHRIGALIADILILAEERNADIENELEKVLAWFEKRD